MNKLLSVVVPSKNLSNVYLPYLERVIYIMFSEEVKVCLESFLGKRNVVD